MGAPRTIPKTVSPAQDAPGAVPASVPLSSILQRDVRALTQARDDAQTRLNQIASIALAAANVDPGALQGYQIAFSSDAIVLTPPADSSNG